MNRKQIDDLLDNTKKIVILGHINPDGDCIGSVFGLALYLDAVFDGSKEILPLVADKDNLDGFIPKSPGKATEEAVKDACADGDYTCIVVDSADESRVAYRTYWDNAKMRIAIDHHPRDFHEECISFKNTSASSCTCILFDMMKKEVITPDIATLLYMGLCHDTGMFQNSNVNPDTYRIAGELMGYGADHDKVVKNYNLRALEDLKKEGFYYQMVTTVCNGKAAFLCSEVTRKYPLLY